MWAGKSIFEIEDDIAQLHLEVSELRRELQLTPHAAPNSTPLRKWRPPSSTAAELRLSYLSPRTHPAGLSALSPAVLSNHGMEVVQQLMYEDVTDENRRASLHSHRGSHKRESQQRTPLLPLDFDHGAVVPDASLSPQRHSIVIRQNGAAESDAASTEQGMQQPDGPEWDLEDASFVEVTALARKSPQQGLKALRERRFVSSDEEAGVFFSCFRLTQLDNEKVLEFVTQAENTDMLHALLRHECQFADFEIDMAFRTMLFQLQYLPKEGQKITRIIEIFGVIYVEDAAESGVETARAAADLGNGILMLNTMLHNEMARGFAFGLTEWIAHNKGRNDGHDFDAGMLTEIFNNVMVDEIRFSETSCFPHAVKSGWAQVRGNSAAGRTAGSLRSLVKRWKRRWVVLSNDCLWLMRAPGGPTAAKHTIHLASSELVAVPEANNTFGLNCREASEVNLILFSCPSEWSCRTWMRKIAPKTNLPFPGVKLHQQESSAQKVYASAFGKTASTP